MRLFSRLGAVTLVNGRVITPSGAASSIRLVSHVLGIDDPPRPGDIVVDVAGAMVFPGLINAHDHLELNHYGRLKGRDRYDNASDWIDDLRPRLRGDADIRANSAHPLRYRLFAGGLKNVLAGATTVAHHNPIYHEFGIHYPVRLVRQFGWAHSLRMENEPVGAGGELGGHVMRRCAATPREVPFIVHAAEGLDRAAAAELDRLGQSGSLGPNTVLVHGVAIDADGWMRLLAAGGSLIWCPVSNMFLFDRTIPARAFLDATPAARDHLCLGTDSRITGARDLLDEMRAAIELGVTPDEVLHMVTTAAARVLRLPAAGRLEVGLPADLVVIPAARRAPAASLLACRRADLELVMIEGRPLVGAPRFQPLFDAMRVEFRSLVVDGAERIADARLMRTLARSPIQEAGVSCR